MCGRTFGERRIDYALIPYSPAASSEKARAVFTELPAPEDDGEPPALHFGLRVELDRHFLKLKPTAAPPARQEALGAIAEALEAARLDAEQRLARGGWMPFLATRESLRGKAEVSDLATLEEEIRSALMGDARRLFPAK